MKKLLSRVIESVLSSIFGLGLLIFFIYGSITEYFRCWLGWKDLASTMLGWAFFASIAIPLFTFAAARYILTGAEY